ncbi:MAG: hypothetical protein WBD56_16475 [Anaerolineales bacterium]
MNTSNPTTRSLFQRLERTEPAAPLFLVRFPLLEDWTRFEILLTTALSIHDGKGGGHSWEHLHSRAIHLHSKSIVL